MTVLFVLMTFGFFLGLDALIRHRRAARVAVTATAPVLEAEPAWIPEPVWVAGYQMPEELAYHRGHTWARLLGPDTVAIGIDDFARQLIGSATRTSLPAVGSWLRQGAKAAALGLDGREVDVVSPLDGEVIEVNDAVARQPNLATSDPYGRGWLLKVRSSELARNLGNLLSGSLARRFMEDTRDRLQHQLMALQGTVLADGGEPVADFARHLPEEDWRHLVHEFLLT
jgi:glycine cleavage system H protein